jgi:hypothetical protein
VAVPWAPFTASVLPSTAMTMVKFRGGTRYGVRYFP